MQVDRARTQAGWRLGVPAAAGMFGALAGDELSARDAP
jgi:hypothetical protein